MTAADPNAAFEYCADLVRRLDYDRWLTTLFAPAPRRGSLLALYAFNLEIARIRETVSEPMLGEIRLQWWREAIDELYQGRARRHAVLEALVPEAALGTIERSLFERLLEARHFDLEARRPHDLAELDDYAAGTSSTLLKLGAQLLSRREPRLLEALDRIGIAWATVGLIRAIPFHAGANRVYIPDAVLARHELTDRDVIAFKEEKTAKLRAAIKEVALSAVGHLDEARRSYPRPERAIQALFLPAVLAQAYLRRLVRIEFAVMRRPVELSRLRKLMLLYGAAARRRY